MHAEGMEAHADYRHNATVHVARITILPDDPRSAISCTCDPGTPHTPVVLRDEVYR